RPAGGPGRSDHPDGAPPATVAPDRDGDRGPGGSGWDRAGGVAGIHTDRP
ncbi:hypothetical protein LCGC14_1503770, partial [marine sediment metagenome]